MQEYRANVVIHLDESLPVDQLQALEKTLGAEAGVFSACVSEQATHLMVVDFDSSAISAQDLLHRVEREGIHGELIGL